MLLPILALSGGAGAVPQVGVASFSIDDNKGWSDTALGAPSVAGMLSAAELQAAVEIPGEDAAAQDPTIVSQGQGGLSGRIADLLLISPMQALDRWSATCTPDPVTVCREAHIAHETVAAAALQSPTAATSGGAKAGAANKLPLFAIIAVLMVVTLVVLVVVGRGIVTRRRLAAGWQAPVAS